MRVKIWGCRGSIPVSGRSYLKYGGDTTCLEIRTQNDVVIIVDSGTGIRNLGRLLLKQQVSSCHLIFTHYHWDHIIGFPFFKPLYRADFSINIYEPSLEYKDSSKIVKKIMEKPYFPISYNKLSADIKFVVIDEKSFMIDSVEIVPIKLNHPNGGFGYKFIENSKEFVFITDNELGFVHDDGQGFDVYKNFISGADVVIHDSEFNETEYNWARSWGHSLYIDSVRLAMEANAKKLILFHHNQNRTDYCLEKIEKKCELYIEQRNSELECVAAYDGMEFSV